MKKERLKTDTVFIIKTKTDTKKVLLRGRLLDYQKSCIQMKTEKILKNRRASLTTKSSIRITNTR